jgi:arylsulfatase A-like enzyme
LTPAAGPSRARTGRIREILAALVPVMAVVLVACTREQRAVRERPDVLLVVVDTLRADHLALYGYARETAPNLTRFARDAILYEKAVSPGTWTVPSHGSILTGRWPSYHGAERVPGDKILAMPVNPNVPMLAEILQSRGYRTVAFIGNSTYLSPLFGFQRGFADYVTGHFWHANEVFDDVVRWLDEHPEPSFVLWNVIDPHEPYDPPPPFDARFPGRRPEHGVMLGELVWAGTKPTAEMIAHFVSQYDGEIAVADDAIGRVLEALKRQGRYDDALIVVTSDHGEMFGEHGAYSHGTPPFEPMVHVPLLVKLPGNRRAGERVARRVSTAAIFATVLRELAIPVPEGTGVAALDEPHPVWVEDVDKAGERVHAGYAGDLKLVRRKTRTGTYDFLYDLARDPDEEHPLQDPLAGAELRAALDAFAAAPRPANVADVPVIDAEHEAKLRALGYVR